MITPSELDGACVLEVADVSALEGSGATRHYRDGELINEQIEHLAIARYPQQDGEAVYLFCCDRSWAVLTDTWHSSTADAREQAVFEYPSAHFSWS